MYKALLVLAVTSILTPAVSSAITTEKFDAMSCTEREAYMSNLLGMMPTEESGATAKVQQLLTHDKFRFYFQLNSNLDEVRKLNAYNATKPNNGDQRVFEVEHAVALTLKQNGILIRVSDLLTVNRNFVPTPLHDYAEEPIWPLNVTNSYKEAVLSMMNTTNRTLRDYAEMICKVDEKQTILVGQTQKLIESAPSVPVNDAAFITKGGELVDEQGKRLTGEQLRAAAPHKEQAPSWEELASLKKKISEYSAFLSDVATDQKNTKNKWDATEKEVEDCLPKKCTFK